MNEIVLQAVQQVVQKVLFIGMNSKLFFMFRYLIKTIQDF